MSRILSALLVLAVAGSAAASGYDEPVRPPRDAPIAPLNPCRPDPCDPGCECIDVDGMAECVCPPPPTKSPITPTDLPTAPICPPCTCSPTNAPTEAPFEPLVPTKAPVEPPTEAPTRPPNPCKPDPCDPGCECIVVDGMAECICPPPPTKAPIEPVTPTDAPVRTPSRY